MLPSIFAGQILIWSGSIISIPSGWALCDGTQGTPDLRDKFIVVAGDTYSVDDLGGTVLHAHDFTSDNHQHSYPITGGITIGAPVFQSITELAQLAGTTDNGNVLPPYYALAYVMKL